MYDVNPPASAPPVTSQSKPALISLSRNMESGSEASEKKSQRKVDGRKLRKFRREDQIKDKECKYCHKMFTNQGLGGHMSRAHPGLSEEYRKKKETR